MKKLVLIIAATIMTTAAWAQSQLQTVKGKTKDGKSINVQYYKGTAQDFIESVKYQLVDELKADNKSKQNSINDLQSQLNKANKRIDNLNDQLKKAGNAGQVTVLNEQLTEKDNEIARLNEQLEQLNAQLKEKEAENNKLRTQVDSLKRANIQLSLNKKRPAKHPVIGVEASMGSVFLSNKNLSNPWEKAVSWNKQAAVYFGTDRLTESLPLSIEVGVGFRSLPMTASISSYQKTENDVDQYDYTAIYENLTERLTINSLEVPIRLCIGQPDKDKVSVYAKLGVSPSFVISSKLSNSNYTKKGYYENWNVTFENIDELGFFNNGHENNKSLTPDSRFNLWGNASFGAYVPLSSSLLFNVGAKLDYPIMKTGSFTSTLSTADDNDNLILNEGLIKYNGRMLIPNLQAGLVYTLK